MASSTFKRGDKVRYRSPSRAHRALWGLRAEVLSVSRRGDGCIRLKLLDNPHGHHPTGLYKGSIYWTDASKVRKADGLLDI